jgi:hypothetical protein
MPKVAKVQNLKSRKIKVKEPVPAVETESSESEVDEGVPEMAPLPLIPEVPKEPEPPKEEPPKDPEPPKEDPATPEESPKETSIVQPPKKKKKKVLPKKKSIFNDELMFDEKMLSLNRKLFEEFKKEQPKPEWKEPPPPAPEPTSWIPVKPKVPLQSAPELFSKIFG